jgi:hypothetical protein
MKRKGQAALEFLTTYGWAFLVILVMIGALAYFGILNPKAFLPNRCTFSPEIDCIEARIEYRGVNTADVSFRFRNNIGSSADFNASITYIGSTNPAVNCSANFGVQAGRVANSSCTFSPATAPLNLVQGDKAKFEITILYKKTDGTYWTPVKGEVLGNIN